MDIEDFRVDDFETLFLDRDGTINKCIPDGYVQSWQDFQFLPGSVEAIYRLSSIFKYIIVVTNQQGIGKGLMIHEDLHTIHGNMIKVIEEGQGRLDEIYYCPHMEVFLPWCRKPRPGMAEQAKKDFPDIDFTRSIMIGDSDVDIAFGKNLGMLTVRIESENPRSAVNENADITVKSLLQFYRLYFLKK